MNRLAIVILLTALLPPAFAAGPDPFPNQPGALSAEQIKTATDEMKLRLGAGPALELAASGNRVPGSSSSSYAVFATPFADFSGRAKTRKRIVCNAVSGSSQWNCSNLHDQIRMTANGVNHDFNSAHFPAGPRDLQMSVDIADFMYSRCFSDQLKALGGAKGAPPFDAISINSVQSYSGEFTVTIGSPVGGDRYKLEKSDRKSDGCGFKIISAHMTKAGIYLPESYAREVERPAPIASAKEKEVTQNQKEAEQDAKRAVVRAEEARVAAERGAYERAVEGRVREEQAAKKRAANRVTLFGWSIDRDDLVSYLMLSSFIGGGLAIVLPWLGLLVSVRAAAATSILLISAASALFAAAEHFDNSGAMVRIELFIFPPLIILAGGQLAYFLSKANAKAAGGTADPQSTTHNPRSLR